MTIAAAAIALAAPFDPGAVRAVIRLAPMQVPFWVTWATLLLAVVGLYVDRIVRRRREARRMRAIEERRERETVRHRLSELERLASIERNQPRARRSQARGERPRR
ncbi:MAG: hypothetical protein ACLP50_28175 [Solirubrobacteraceae bacterium]